MSTPRPRPPQIHVDESLPVAGILAACAASQSPDPTWLRSYLSRTFTSLSLASGTRTAMIEQALEISSSDNRIPNALHSLDGYLSASSFGPSTAVPLVTALLYADVSASTAYDARARETLARFVSALHLPPTILYLAERDLALLVDALSKNADIDGKNVEAVDYDEAENKRRKNAKWLKIGTASVLGGIALGLSGGLIAPALLPALGSVGLAGVSAPLAALGGGGAVAVGGLFGAAGAGVGAAAMASRTGEVEEFVFEPFSMLQGSKRSTYDSAIVTTSRRVHEVVVPLKEEEELAGRGGLLVWELLTSQDYAMIVPGAMAFGVQFRAFPDKKAGKGAEWLLPEEKMDAGGLNKRGNGRKRRTTGAVTVLGSGEYILRFRLLPGSLPVRISYRVAIVPPGKDPPIWVMEENEYQPADLLTGDVRSLSMAIFVPGLIAAEEVASYPGMFADQFSSVEGALQQFNVQAFAVRWESSLLMELSDAMRSLIGKMAVSAAAQKGAMMVAPALIGAVALPISVIGALRTIIGNTWARTISRAAECGYMLAVELASRSFGNRPVILAGYSAGALVIFCCLEELARRNLVGIVHDVCLIGAPCSASLVKWREIRTAVAGRLVNVYNPSDWYLELYHRGTNLGAVAGTRPVEDSSGVANVENVCLSQEQVGTHMEYAQRSSQILLDVGFVGADCWRSWTEADLQQGFQKDEVATPVMDKQYCSETEFNIVDGSTEDDVVVFEAIGHSKRRPCANTERPTIST